MFNTPTGRLWQPIPYEVRRHLDSLPCRACLTGPHRGLSWHPRRTRVPCTATRTDVRQLSNL